MYFFTGIDIGSTAIKIAILNEERELIAQKVVPTGSKFNENAIDAYHTLIRESNIELEEVKYVVSTGYGRRLYKSANQTVSEITANAIGAVAVCKEHSIRTIINIGGQDSKIIQISPQGLVQNFIMNDKCAAGTGRFLEMVSRNLEVDIDKMGELHRLSRDKNLTVNSTCAVFAESEIISLLAEGHKKEEIVSGIHVSISKRIVRLAGRITIQDDVLFDGGTAYNVGLIDALEDEFMRDLHIPESPQFTTAIGAANMALDIFSKSLTQSSISENREIIT
jgi:predicted CoA-substrate-specific enzyme activase